MNYRNCLKTHDTEVMELWLDICDRAEKDKEAWIAALRKQGFKAAHPNDGWVDREKNRVHFAYPQFNDGVEVGSLVMLGWPSRGGRPVRVVEKETGMFLCYWKFEDVLWSEEKKEWVCYER